ncbi:hypothetical protein [Polaribacter cellanae]|uniref:META domain-containing protein n=1 Tax=Polaribacter cellanae TaxID=2818493 RepID=A0A975CKR4_9FLAO|nr:hypothetical protein [Polaribacter cellanae]QTE21513.1 hypothetical protein J3359_11840 [Polaribacter cellanae]
MKNMFLILSIFFLITGCSNEEETKQQENSIYGTWKLTSFVNRLTNNVLVDSDFSNSNRITIIFNRELNFTGSTVINDFSGSFSIDNRSKLLIFSEFSTTEANETEWGNLFYQSLNSNYNKQLGNWQNTYEIIQENTLKIFYSEQEYMTLEKL